MSRQLLNEMKAVRGVESMTHLDMLAAFCMAKFGSKSRHREIISKSTSISNFDISSVSMFKRRPI